MDDSAITRDEIIDAEAKPYEEETKTLPKNFNAKKTACKTQTLYVLLVFLLIIKALLITVGIYCLL